jgi:hypothetical protein
MSGHAKELYRIAADQEREAKNRACPKAHALRGRLLFLAAALDADQHKLKLELHGHDVSLQAIINSGRDIDDAMWGPYATDVEECLRRAEAVTGVK